eukprot:CAMPEP_0117426034 /NCGR_PEP_ID=MMETSP0758-20121206/6217_1 /TAXON_ID=63605 /ORGANISM="Percolomonas cosmopolitus, Strain AE-1 (ATCC 50343)" /LENGTH=524 /DNA_ID=CAMNT_0005210937 /DNA_START=229 /DNA_END=1804 /DNA_ORIENTATION=+
MAKQQNLEGPDEEGFDYDVIILGCGPGGYAAAIKSGVDLGKRTCIVEKNRIGGAGIWDGALSSKAMWETSNEWRKIIDPTPRGYTIKHCTVYMRDVQRRVMNAVKKREAQMKKQLDYYEIPVEYGIGRFLDNHTIEVVDEKTGKQLKTIRGRNIIISTGSRPREHAKYPTDGKSILNSDHMMAMQSFPRSMVIIGAGVVGCEYATIFANFNKTRVYLVSKYKNILPFEDEEVSQIVSKKFELKHIQIQEGDLVDLKLVANKDPTKADRVEYTVKKNSGEEESMIVDQALFCIGRVPNLDNIGLENISPPLKLNKRGQIDTYRVGSTNHDHIYGVGDVTPHTALVNMAEIEGRQVVRNAFGNENFEVKENNLPYIFFVDPLVAAVGMNETEAIRKRISYRVALYDYDLCSRAIAKKRTTGMIKLIVTGGTDDPKKMKLLGVRAMGPAASSMIEVIATTIGGEHSLHDLIVNTKTAYPAMTEGLQECQRLLTGTSIYKPEVFPEFCRVKEVIFDEEDVADPKMVEK